MWATLLRNHAADVPASDFFLAVTATFQRMVGGPPQRRATAFRVGTRSAGRAGVSRHGDATRLASAGSPRTRSRTRAEETCVGGLAANSVI